VTCAYTQGKREQYSGFNLTLYAINNVFFFFSSRRRHTRFSRDWSSDVCSSDLKQPWVVLPEGTPATHEFYDLKKMWPKESLERRSEERRVGKECRSRWSADQRK